MFKTIVENAIRQQAVQDQSLTMENSRVMMMHESAKEHKQ